MAAVFGWDSYSRSPRDPPVSVQLVEERIGTSVTFDDRAGRLFVGDSVGHISTELDPSPEGSESWTHVKAHNSALHVSRRRKNNANKRRKRVCALMRLSSPSSFSRSVIFVDDCGLDPATTSRSGAFLRARVNSTQPEAWHSRRLKSPAKSARFLL